MFDAKNLLEALMRGNQPAPSTRQQGMGGLGDILGQLASAMQPAPGSGRGPSTGSSAADSGGGLADILGRMMQGGGAQPGAVQSNAPVGGQPGAGAAQAGGLGALGDILGQLQKQLGGSGQSGGQGGLMDILTQVLAQATAGVKDGAGKIDAATGASGRAREAIGQATGKSPDELLAQLQEMIKSNQLGAGAALGGLGGLVLGTRTGRSAAIGAAKLGALALIGGLAYKAYQNYSEGKPIVAGTSTNALVTEAAPNGSGFEPQAVSNDTATLYLRAMIGAAAADGRIDPKEHQQIMGGLAQAGLDDAAHSFLRQELDNPASPEDLASAVKSPAEAIQVYTAARLAIDPDADDENRQYLASLAAALGIDAKLAAHVESAAKAG